METIDRADAYALLADGRCVRVRTVTPEDWQAVHEFVATLSPESLYRRFFSVPSRPAEMLANLLCAPRVEQSQPVQGALVALLGGRAVGLAEWYRTRVEGEAEIAFEVSDALQGHGVATLLAEHLMLAVERVGIRTLTAITQGGNRRMLEVFLALGVQVDRDWEGGDCRLTIPLGHAAVAAPSVLDVIAGREAVADEASLQALFAPREIAVFGAAGDPATEALMRNLEGFAGAVRRAGARGEVLPGDARPDLAVVASPPEDAVAAARRCAAAGAKALIVTAVGFPVESGRELLRVCHEAGMRLIGPGSVGVAVPRGARGFGALLAEHVPAPGPAGVAVQSGGVGLALLSRLRRVGVGVSAFAGVGEKYDVSANDLLLHWEKDPETRVGLLHVESFGNPRKFARTARRLSQRIPLLAVDPEQSPSQARTALYAQAGIIALPSLGALVGAAALSAHRPAPRGPRVAVLGNTHGMTTLAAQSCIRAGLEVVQTLDLTPAADTGRLAEAIAQLRIADPAGADVHALVLALAPTVPCAPDPAAAAAASCPDAVVLAVVADQPESVVVLTSTDGDGFRLPAYNDAGDAALALSAVVRAAAVARRSPGQAPLSGGGDLPAARALVDDWMAQNPHGRELDAAEGAALLEAVGIGSDSGVGPTGARLIAWQDPVFGALVSVASADGHEVSTLLAPTQPQEALAAAERVTALAASRLADAAVRLAALIDDCPELASLNAAITLDAPEPAAREVRARLAPSAHENPYLRRLRRAPVE